MSTNGKIRYFLYARKSSESEDKQVASIESQVSELTKLAKTLDLNVVDHLFESKSAKKLGRPVFKQLLRRIIKGEADGIICWKLDRLARNLVDGGQIVELLQQGVIREIRTISSKHVPEDHVLPITLEFGMANQYSRDLSTNVKRGKKSKAERGWHPAYTPLGYLHNSDKASPTEIIPDPLRYPLVKEMFNLMLSGKYGATQILRIAKNELRLKNRIGNKLSLHGVIYILTNPFYYGEFEYPRNSGNWFQGKHKPMITRSEFDRVQVLLGKQGRPRAKKWEFAYRGPLTCGECGGVVTAEFRKKKQKNGNVHFYTYYHCTKKLHPECTQGHIEEKRIEKQIDELLAQIQIPQEFTDWALKELEQESEQEHKEQKRVVGQHQKEHGAVTKRLERYMDMRADGELTAEEYSRKKRELEREQFQLRGLIADNGDTDSKWIENAEEVFTFATEARETFKKGNMEDRREILQGLGSNLSILDRKLCVEFKEPLEHIKNMAGEIRSISDRVEPLKFQNKEEHKKVLEKSYSSSAVVRTGT